MWQIRKEKKKMEEKQTTWAKNKVCSPLKGQHLSFEKIKKVNKHNKSLIYYLQLIFFQFYFGGFRCCAIFVYYIFLLFAKKSFFLAVNNNNRIKRQWIFKKCYKSQGNSRTCLFLRSFVCFFFLFLFFFHWKKKGLTSKEKWWSNESNSLQKTKSITFTK